MLPRSLCHACMEYDGFAELTSQDLCGLIIDFIRWGAFLHAVHGYMSFSGIYKCIFFI